mgnify:CR=1 FL=1
MTLEFVDMKWTVVSKVTLEAAVAGAVARLPLLGNTSRYPVLTAA